MSLKIVEVNKEKEVVKILADENTNLKGYAIVDATFSEDGDESDTFRHIFIFPELIVKKGEYVFLYTGLGKYRKAKAENNDKIIIHVFYWNSKENVWNDTGDKATLIKYSVVHSRVAE